MTAGAPPLPAGPLRRSLHARSRPLALGREPNFDNGPLGLACRLMDDRMVTDENGSVGWAAGHGVRSFFELLDACSAAHRPDPLNPHRSGQTSSKEPARAAVAKHHPGSWRFGAP
jgi:hypothetical protein